MKTNRPLRLLSLFSGIGAFERALENLSIPFTISAFCEINPYASKAYSILHQISESANLRDVAMADGSRFHGLIDMVTYGFPCQDISIAGKKAGFFDEEGNATRSGLFFDALRIIREAKPVVAIAENVKHLTSIKMEKEFTTVIRSLETIGYNNYWRILNAKDYGLPQNRERVFIVSIRKDTDNSFLFPEPEPLNLRMKDFLDSNVDESYFLSHEQCSRVVLLSPPSKGCHEEAKIIQAADLSHYQNDQMNRVYSPDGLAPTLKSVSGGGREIKVLDNHRIRKLTEREYFRLMGFTAEDAALLKANGISKTQLYRMAGNSIAVPVLEKLFRALGAYFSM